MKIRKDGVSFTLTESELKKIVSKQMINEGLLSSDAKETKDEKIKSIIRQLRKLSNTIDSAGEGIKASKLNDKLHSIENKIRETFEDVNDMLEALAEIKRKKENNTQK